MNLNDIFMKLIPAITSIFKLGYIPSPLDFHELTEEQYKVYQKQSGDKSKPVYAVIPKDYKYLEQSNVINIAKKDDMVRAGMAAVFLLLYAKERGCESEESEDVLRFAAARFPRSITAGTKYERPALKILKHGEPHLSEKDEWIDFLASLMGDGATLDFKVTYEKTGKIENISWPIKKKR